MKMLIFILLLAYGNYYVNCYIHTDSVLVYETVKAYHKLLKFTEKYMHLMNTDGICGMAVADANLRQILRLPIPPKIINAVQNLQHRTSEAIEKRLKVLQEDFTGNMYEMIMFQNLRKLLNWSFWENVNNTFIKNQLKVFNPRWHHGFYLYGYPTEDQSDSCLSELYRATGEHKECHISNECKRIFLDPDNSHGYPLTHKVLFWVYFTRARCIDHYNAKEIKNKLCSNVLRETKGIMLLDPFDPILRDLFFEQVVLCGMEGYEEFLEKREWLKTALSWQNKFGCFETHHFKRIKRIKRLSSDMAYGCENHITGLSLGYLSLNLKYLLTTNKHIVYNFL